MIYFSLLLINRQIVMVCLLSVCVSQENYKKVVRDLLPKLQTLDGEDIVIHR